MAFQKSGRKLDYLINSVGRVWLVIWEKKNRVDAYLLYQNELQIDQILIFFFIMTSCKS